MTSHLTRGQRASLESALLQRQHSLDQRLAEQMQGQSRAEHAHEALLLDNDDAPKRESEREMDMATVDNELQELSAVKQALNRLKDGVFGACSACDGDIPFDRLKIEPWALRCVRCQAAFEQAGAR